MPTGASAVGAKGAAGCCCSQCGVTLPTGVNCCLCVCNKLCVRVSDASFTGTGTTDDCDCDSWEDEIDWDPDECAWTGTITCGSLTVDLRFDIKECPAETGTAEECKLCLTSECLNLTGVCGDTGAMTGTSDLDDSCQPFTEGLRTGDCGKYVKHCTQDGGPRATWLVHYADCGGGTDQDCSSLQVTAECYPRINPTRESTPQERFCKDCDCVCEYVRMTYSESGPGGHYCSHQVNVKWEELTELTGTGTGSFSTGEKGWLYEFDCPGGSQRVTVKLYRETDGCCYWETEITKGKFAGDVGTGTGVEVGTGTGTDVNGDVKLEKTNCPGVDLNYDINLPDDTGSSTVGRYIALLDIECAPCAENQELCCCDSFLGVPPKDSVTLTVDGPGCPDIDGQVFTLTVTAPTSDSCNSFAGGGTIGYCDEDEVIPTDVGFTLQCEDRADGFVWYLLFTPSSSGCANAGITQRVRVEPGWTCSPFNLRFCGFVLDDNFPFVTDQCDCCPGGFCVDITD